MEKEIQRQLPNGSTYLDGIDVAITVESLALMTARTNQLTTALDANNWLAVLDFCPIRESSACENIIAKLGFRTKGKYTEAVLNLLKTDSGALDFTRGLFFDLFQKLETTTP